MAQSHPPQCNAPLFPALLTSKSPQLENAALSAKDAKMSMAPGTTTVTHGSMGATHTFASQLVQFNVTPFLAQPLPALLNSKQLQLGSAVRSAKAAKTQVGTGTTLVTHGKLVAMS